MAYINRELALKLLGRNSITKSITFADGVSIYDAIADIPAADVVPKSEVARDIFEEIENLFAVENFRLICNRQAFAELKKKYTNN